MDAPEKEIELSFCVEPSIEILIRLFFFSASIVSKIEKKNIITENVIII